MIENQEIIERSLYQNILEVAIALGLTVDPKDYQPPSPINQSKFQQDQSNIKADKGTFVYVFGIGNNQSRDQKWTPRITIESQGFYPGNVGLPNLILEKKAGIGFNATEVPSETINQYFDIHLVANTQQELRLLHTILMSSIPQRGYIKPWPSEVFLKEGNIFLELYNYFNHQDTDYGILEKVYQFIVYDTLLEVKDIPGDIPMIGDISLILENANLPEGKPFIEVETTP